MFPLLNFAKKVSENPKILVPIIGFIIIGIAIEHYVLAAPSNPLPAPGQVQNVTYSRNLNYFDTEHRSLPMIKYKELWSCLEGAKRIMTSGGGELSATLNIRKKNGSKVEARLYEHGLVKTSDGIFEGVDAGKSNKLYDAIAGIVDGH